jgi:dihydroorotase
MNIAIINANIVNENRIFKGAVIIENGLIKEVIENNDFIQSDHKGLDIIDAPGKYLLPGVIDDHVHFREPGLTHKADIYTESKAAVAGGVTSYMEMPNTVPNTTTVDLLEEKFKLASERSLANYSFYIGATNENIEELKKINNKDACGIKLFMGSSTGNMLVSEKDTLKQIFSLNSLIAVHCEDEKTIKENLEKQKTLYGDNIPIASHPLIRSAEACFKSSSYAVSFALKYNTRLHLLHLSSSDEMVLLENSLPIEKKKITAEVCVHHLWFTNMDYQTKGNLIKLNPAIKSMDDRDALWQALIDNRIDVIATDHSPHTFEEKNNMYLKAPSGAPFVQHSLVAMLEMYHQKKITLETIVNKMCHAPAKCFNINKRGFIRAGYFADLVLVDLNSPWIVNKTNILSKCNWSPFEGDRFYSCVTHTFVNGNLVFENGKLNEKAKGMRLQFNRD